MDEKLKNIITGGGIQLGAKTATNMTFNVLAKQQGDDGSQLRKAYPWLYGFGPIGIPYDDWIVNVGLPAILAVVGIAAKKEKVKNMAIGAGLTGAGTMLNQILMRLGKAYPNPYFASAGNGNSVKPPLVASIAKPIEAKRDEALII